MLFGKCCQCLPGTPGLAGRSPVSEYSFKRNPPSQAKPRQPARSLPALSPAVTVPLPGTQETQTAPPTAAQAPKLPTWQ